MGAGHIPADDREAVPEEDSIRPDLESNRAVAYLVIHSDNCEEARAVSRKPVADLRSRMGPDTFGIRDAIEPQRPALYRYVFPNRAPPDRRGGGGHVRQISRGRGGFGVGQVAREHG